MGKIVKIALILSSKNKPFSKDFLCMALTENKQNNAKK
jgi:hypothetical protein